MGNFDPDAFLASGGAAVATPTPSGFNPDAFLAQGASHPASSFNPDAFLAATAPPPPPSTTPASDQAVAEPNTVTGKLGEVWRGIDIKSLPADVGKALVGLIGATESPKAFKQAWDVLHGVPVAQAIPESQTFVGIEKKPIQERAKIAGNELINVAGLWAGGKAAKEAVGPAPEAAGAIPAPAEAPPVVGNEQFARVTPVNEGAGAAVPADKPAPAQSTILEPTTQPEPKPVVPITEENAAQAATDIGGLSYGGVQSWPADSGIPSTLEFTITEPGKETTLSVPPGITPEELIARRDQKLADFAAKEPATTYDEAQTKIDNIENALEAKGVDPIRLVDPSAPYATELIKSGAWGEMPPELVQAYKERDTIGAAQLRESTNHLIAQLKTGGLTDTEAAAVLKNYSIHPGETDAVRQTMAAEHAQKTAGSDPTEQAESVAIKLAIERGENFDELRDISPKTLRDAANAVKTVRQYLNGGEPPMSAGTLPPTEPAAAQPEPAPPVTDTDPHISAIANRFTQERSASGEIGEIAPSQGYSTVDLTQRGLNMAPEEVNQHISDVMNDAGGDPKMQASAIRGEEARLSKQSHDLSRAAEANPTDINARVAADNAFKDLTDFHNGPVAKLKNNWHAQGMAMQGEVPVDLSTLNGLREAWLKDTGKAPPASIEPTLRKAAKRVREVNAEENGAMQRLGQEIDKASRSRKLPTADEVRANIRERMGLGPCKV